LYTLPSFTALTIANQTLPSGIYSAFAPQVLDSYNDVELRYLAYDNWTYSNLFQCKIQQLIFYILCK